MENLKTERKILRTTFTKARSNFIKHIDSKSDADDIQVSYEYLSQKAECLFQIDQKLKDLWLAMDDLNEDEYAKDSDTVEIYVLDWIKAKTMYEKFQQKVLEAQSDQNDSKYDSASVSGISAIRKKNLRLPKLDLPKFNGLAKNWIGFWGIFKKIDTDVNIDDDEKFAYLLQSMEPSSPARTLVESFPPCGKNYKEALAQLKSRYARDELLIEIYVRELLGLVLDQAAGNMLSIASLHDKLKTQLRALETLGVTSDKYAAMLYPLVESALPVEILRVWERQRNSEKETDILNNLLNFVKLEVESEERIKITRQGLHTKDSQLESKIPTAACLVSGEVKSFEKSSSEKPLIYCIWCDKSTHSSLECYKAQKMSVEERQKLVNNKKVCHVCLKIGHSGKKCRSYTKCLFCSKRHAVLLCPGVTKIKSIDAKPQTSNQSGENSDLMLSTKNKTTLLQTLKVKIGDMIVRAFIDTGAQRSYITKDIVNKLGLKPTDEEVLAHSLFGGIETQKEKHYLYDLSVNAATPAYKFTLTMTALDKTTICSFIPRVHNNSSLQYQLSTHNITLSDFGDDVQDISLLIGADYAGMIMTGNIKKINDEIIAIETKLGWTVQGSIKNPYNTVFNATICMNDLGHLWNLELIGIEDPKDNIAKKIKESEVIEDFKKNISINANNRYEVKLPWKINNQELLDNKDLAKKRLLSTTKRLESLNELENYEAVFKEWLELGVIEVETNEEIPGHYLPHHAVIKNSSQTTRVRPVFDASAKDKNGNSINAYLDKGQNYLELIPILLTRFRTHEIGITADIKKAFLQIALPDTDRNYLRFLWWANKERKEVITYRHCRVVFGLTCSPFLLAATIIYHLEQYNSTRYKETALLLKNSFYVDNTILSIDSRANAEEFIQESKRIMLEGQFDLRGWITGPTKCSGTDDQKVTSVLGMNWDPKSDHIYCNINPLKENSDKLTKRALLSITQKIFDPIGITCPTTLIPKLLLQKTWRLSTNWDTELPEEIRIEFHEWSKSLHLLTECIIPRRLTVAPINTCKNSLHVFSDASGKAYAACIFLRSETPQEVTVKLVLAKSRVAPVKELTIPRMELLAALMSTRLYLQVKEALKLNDIKSYFWTDSTVVLAWIVNDGDWNVFVKNRVREIRKNTNNEDWRHVPGSMNPADLPSRGCQIQTLIEKRWWEGPAWLKYCENKWPISTVLEYDEKELNRERKVKIVVNLDSAADKFSSRFSGISNYRKIINVFALLLKIADYCKNKRSRSDYLCSDFNPEEFIRAEKRMFMLIQSETFTEEYMKHKLKSLQVYKDEEGLMRVQTRLFLSDEDENFKYPILLPGKHDIIKRLVEYKHVQLRHAGLNILTSQLRNSWWIIGVKRIARNVISKCWRCKRYKVLKYQTPCAQLPRNRVKDAAVFEVTGVDAAGPLYLNTGEKCWLMVFTCAVYRAIHLELVMSMSTESFIMAFRRFVARRGRCKIVYSDNGTNFVGAENLMSKVNWQEIQQFSNAEQMKWIFNPPAAPWWGGWWERLIQMVKQLLLRNLGKATLSYIELETLLCDIESLINSRPLTYTTENETLRPLTPASFLQCLPGNEVPELDSIDAQNLKLRIKYIQKLRSDLRQRFRNEYLSLLVCRQKESNNPIRIGDVVLIETEEKRLYWPLGIVIEVYEGQDGNIRVAKIKTADGIRTRPVQRLFPLEATDSENNKVEITTEENKNADIGEDSGTTEVKTRLGRLVRPPRRLNL